MPLLLDLAPLTMPAPGEVIFRRPGPLVLEIGFGNGGFLLHMAKSHPEWNILGADPSRGSISRAWKRLHRGQVQNVRLFRGSALFLFRNVIVPRGLSRVYVNFPDPWPKERHSSRRLIQAEFFPLLASRLNPKGRLYFTTDDELYFARSLELAHASGLFEFKRAQPPRAALETKYARKWKAAARSVNHAVFRKVSEPDKLFPPVIERHSNMHHALLNGALPQPSQFTSFVHPFEGGQALVLDVMRMVGVEGLVFMVRTQEPDLTQEVLIQVRPARAAQADQVVSIMTFGQPLATRGTREAAKAVTGWLLERGLSIVETYY